MQLSSFIYENLKVLEIMTCNCLDVNIIDLKGNEYEINSIHMEGNDVMYIVIKTPYEHYISKRNARELIEKVKDEYR